MLNKKLKKLIRDPNLFFSDMVGKQKKKYAHVYTKKVEGHYQYTVVSAVYNVGRYLDDYFKSIVEQSLNFKKHIHLIMVDDGSLDDSASIIKKWQNKYPQNITYLWKENGGQASARNFGLEHVNTEWVTFIDPDDTLDINYFKHVDDNIYKNNKIKLASCNIVFFIEKTKTFKNNHPLNYKFKNKPITVPITSDYNDVQLSASSAFFLFDIVKRSSLNFDSTVKPNFEDGKFISEYLLSISEGDICFINEAKYIYRKREDGTSTLDTSWQRVERFADVFENGYIKLLKEAVSKHAIIPKYIQRAVLYELFWYIRHLVKNPERVDFLSTEEKDKFIGFMHEAFSFIDTKEIMSFNLAGCWFYHKIGAISYFKNQSVESQYVYINGYDACKNLVKLTYYYLDESFENIEIDGDSTIPVFSKIANHDFLKDTFINEKVIWLDITSATSISIDIGGVTTFISLGGKNFKTIINVSDIIKHFNSIKPKYRISEKYRNCWLLMDRDIQADDNAEHLYKHIMENHPEQPIYFAIRRNSHDWNRLLNDNFKLIEFGSQEHEDVLRSCSKVISSHANYYVTNYLGKNMLAGRHFIFLQHGVIKDDLSGWLNNVEQMNCFVTSTTDEYQSIISNESRYVYGKKEVVLTGLPRHDRLLRNLDKKEKIILIMPTWRQNAVGALTGEGDTRTINPHFMETKFATAWFDFIHSSELKDLLEQYNYKAVFFPHSNIQPYVPLFKVPDYIETASHADGSIQDFFIKASLMITDFSSTAFEMAVQRKPTLYYQFDSEDCYSGGHTYSRGYFDYRNNGFGIVSEDEKELIDSLEQALINDCIPDPITLERMNNAFPYRDGGNCERTYKAIKALDEPINVENLDVELLKHYAVQASNHSRWAIAEERWKNYKSYVESLSEDDCIYLVQCLRMQGKFNEAYEIASSISNKNHQLLHECALIMMSKLKWKEALQVWEYLGEDKKDNLYYCASLAFAGEQLKLKYLFEGDTENAFLKICYLFSIGDWDNVVILWDRLEGQEFLAGEKQECKHIILLLISHIFRIKKMYEQAHKCLLEYEKYESGNIFCRYEIASLAFECGNWQKVISQLNSACKDNSSLPVVLMYYYVVAAQELNKDVGLLFLEYESENNVSSMEHNDIHYYSRILMRFGRWREAYELLSMLDSKNYDDIYYQAICLKELGDMNHSYYTLTSTTLLPNSNGLILRAELAQLNDDWQGAYQSWLEYLHSSSEAISAENIEQLQRLKIICNSAPNIY